MITQDLSAAELARRCADERTQYHQQQPVTTQFCFELVRRALISGEAETWGYVLQAYQGQVQTWIRTHADFAATGESEEFFANGVWASFERSVRQHGLERFPSLGALLQYLKKCVWSTVKQYRRDHAPVPSVELGPGIELEYEPNLLHQAQQAELWRMICAALPSERDQQLAYLCFVQDLKPAQIVAADPSWGSPTAVSNAIFRIRAVLRRDQRVRAELGFDAADQA